MLLSLDGTFLVQILNFVVFWMLLNVLFIAPTRRAIETRQRFIETQYREADEFSARARALQAQAEAIIDEARRKTEEAMRAAAAEGAEESRAIERKALEEVAATIALAHATVANERAEAVAKQGPFVEELAQSMVDQALRVEPAA
jgi:F-type H+-transporting ATPase subunit b